MSVSPATTQALDKLTFRCIGPPRGGRVVAVAGHPTDQATFYFGAVAGGIWKTDDGGQYWRNISDGYLNTSSVGALAVSPSDPNVIYAGMGEACIRIDVSHGDGVYKSTDGGDTWTHCGLADTRHIGNIVVHPTNPDIVYVAALGHAFGRNEERGVFRSRDGGATWQRVLYKSDKAGAIDITIDPRNPRILYATVYEMYRNFWDISSGGPDSGIWRSTDGGDTWQDISRNKGLPKGIMGKIGIAASPAQTGRVWALIEAADGDTGMYRTDDGGDSWQRVSDHKELSRRAWYYMHVFADPVDADTVYVLCLRMWKSTDGGANWSEIPTPHGDNHALWIDPKDPRRMIEGNDGGANVTFNGGRSWSTIYNQTTAQFYRLTTDNQFPYRVYGTQQDNSSISVPSRTGSGAITWADCYPAGTGESGHIAVHAEDPNIVMVGAIGSSPGGGGALQKYDHRTKQIQLVTIWPEATRGRGAEAWKYRFQWTFPIRFSPHDPDLLYAAGNIMFRSTNFGQSWEPFSPDLTYADPETLQAPGGPINRDTTGAENYATIYAFEESPLRPGLLWTGSDDGLVHVSKDGGETWENVTPPDMQPRTMVHSLDVSPHDPAVCYLAATRYKLDDYAPYLYKTTDYGATWTPINNGLPEDDFTRVVREDPARRGLLWAGTETGLYISFDDGGHWHRLGGNFPVTPVHDLVRKDNDLVIATHGRSFWILDDVTLIHQLAEQFDASAVTLFEPASTVRLAEPLFKRWLFSSAGRNYMVTLGVPATVDIEATELGGFQMKHLDAGEDIPAGVVLHYYLPETPENAVSLTIRDGDGNALRAFSSQKRDDEDKSERIPADAGLNRFVWDFRVEGPPPIPGAPMALPGPMVTPGTYKAELRVGEVTASADVTIIADPRVQASADDLQQQYDLQIQMRDTMAAAIQAVGKIRKLKKQVDSWRERAGEDNPVADATQALAERLGAIEGALVQTEGDGFFDMNYEARLITKLGNLPVVVASADSAPTQQARDVYAHLAAQVDEQVTALQDVIANDIPALNRLIAEQAVPAIAVD